MSTELNEKREVKTKNKELVHNIICILSGLIVGALVGSVITTAVNKKTVESNNSSTSGTSVVSDTSDTSDEPVITKLESQDEIDTAIKEIESVLDFVQSKPSYLEVMTSNSDYDTYLYNSNNEIAVQASSGAYTVFFTNDGHSIRFNSIDEQMDKDTAIDVMTTVKNALTGIKEKKDGFSMLKETYEGDDDKIKDYAVETKGLTACKEVYKAVSEEYADKLIDILVEYINSSESIDYEPVIRYGFIFDDSNNLNMYCEIIINEIANVNWYCSGYTHTDDWKLDEKWYTTEFSEDNISDLMKLIASESTKIKGVVNKLADDLGINEDTSESNNNSSSVSDSETESDDKNTNESTSDSSSEGIEEASVTSN